MGWQDDEVVNTAPSASGAPASPWDNDEIIKSAPPSSFDENVVRPIARAGRDIATGIAGIADLPIMAVNAGLEAAGSSARGSLPSDMVGKGYDALTGTGELTKPRSTMERIVDAAAQAVASGGGASMAKGAAGMAGKVMESMTPKTAADTVALAGAGAGGQGASEAAQAVMPDNRTVNALAPLVGTVAGAASSGSVAKGAALIKNGVKGEISASDQATLDTAEKYGLDKNLPAGTVSGDKTQQGVFNAMQNIPDFMGGTSGKMEALQSDVEKAKIQNSSEVQSAAKEYTAQQYDSMIKAKFSGIKDIMDAANTQGDRQVAAQAILDRMKNSAGDAPAIIKADADSQAFQKWLISDKMYAEVGRLSGNAPVPLTKTNATLDSEIANLQAGHGTYSNQAIATLQKLKSDFNSPKQVGSGKTALVDSQGNTLTTGQNAKPNTYINLRRTTSNLYKQAQDAQQGNDSASGAALMKVYGALKDDIGAFPKNTGNLDLQRAADRADNYYKKNIVPQNAKQLNQLYASSPNDEDDRLLYGLIKAGKYGDRAQMLYSALSPKGQAATRYSMVQDAYNSALDKDAVFNPAKFDRNLHDRQAATGVFFKGNDKFELDGIRNAMKSKDFNSLLQKIDESVSTKPTGEIKAASAAGAAAATASGHVPIISAPLAIGTAHVIRWALTSPQGRNFMLRASSLPPGSAAMSKLVDQIRMAIPTMGTQAAKGATAEPQGQ